MAEPNVIEYIPSPSGSSISDAIGSQFCHVPATWIPFVSIAPFATSHAMFTLRVTSITQSSHSPQHTTGRVVSAAGIVSIRFTNWPLWITQEPWLLSISWIVHPSAEYLNSTVSPTGRVIDTSHTLSPSASLIASQFPHQLLNVPFNSGVVNELVTLFIFTWKVTSEVWIQLIVNTVESHEPPVNPAATVPPWLNAPPFEVSSFATLLRPQGHNMSTV